MSHFMAKCKRRRTDGPTPCLCCPDECVGDQPLTFLNRPVFPQDPATFDDRSLAGDIATGGDQSAPWIVGATLLAFAFVLYCIAVAGVRS